MDSYSYRRAMHMRREKEMRRERRRTVVIGIVAVIVMLLLYGVAGALDAEDRTQGLGASMLPSAEWRVYAAD